MKIFLKVNYLMENMIEVDLKVRKGSMFNGMVFVFKKRKRTELN